MSAGGGGARGTVVGRHSVRSRDGGECGAEVHGRVRSKVGRGEKALCFDDGCGRG
jgi:hypothetical protein